MAIRVSWSYRNYIEVNLEGDLREYWKSTGVRADAEMENWQAR